MKRILLSLTALLVLSTSLIWCKSPTYIYAHGLADTKMQAYKYANILFSKDDNLITFDFPDATSYFWRVNFIQANLGQRKDISTLASVFYEQIKEQPKQPIIGIGVSRGGATWLNFMGIYRPKNVKALIVESPPDNIAYTVSGIVHTLIPYVFIQYDPYGIQSQDNIARIPKGIPILITSLKDDHVVPHSSSIRIYLKLIESGHLNVHLYTFTRGKHGKIVLSNQDTYRNIAHAFYKKYGLPYNKDSAHAGQKIFAKAQPTRQELLYKR